MLKNEGRSPQQNSPKKVKTEVPQVWANHQEAYQRHCVQESWVTSSLSLIWLACLFFPEEDGWKSDDDTELSRTTFSPSGTVFGLFYFSQNRSERFHTCISRQKNKCCLPITILAVWFSELWIRVQKWTVVTCVPPQIMAYCEHLIDSLALSCYLQPSNYSWEACNQVLFLTWYLVTWRKGSVGVDGDVIILRILKVSSDMFGSHIRTGRKAGPMGKGIRVWNQVQDCKCPQNKTGPCFHLALCLTGEKKQIHLTGIYFLIYLLLSFIYIN